MLRLGTFTAAAHRYSRRQGPSPRRKKADESRGDLREHRENSLRMARSATATRSLMVEGEGRVVGWTETSILRSVDSSDHLPHVRGVVNALPPGTKCNRL